MLRSEVRRGLDPDVSRRIWQQLAVPFAGRGSAPFRMRLRDGRPGSARTIPVRAFDRCVIDIRTGRAPPTPGEFSGPLRAASRAGRRVGFAYPLNRDEGVASRSAGTGRRVRRCEVSSAASTPCGAPRRSGAAGRESSPAIRRASARNATAPTRRRARVKPIDRERCKHAEAMTATARSAPHAQPSRPAPHQHIAPVRASALEEHRLGPRAQIHITSAAAHRTQRRFAARRAGDAGRVAIQASPTNTASVCHVRARNREHRTPPTVNRRAE